MSKLPHVGTTIFTVMSQLANEHNAINLSQGFPNFPVDHRLQEIVKETAMKNSYQYKPMAGSPSLLETISKKINASYRRNINAQAELLVTAGATEGIFSTIMALVSAGDEVVILDPSYDCYEPAITLTGATTVRVQLSEDFMPDWDAIRKAFSNKTKMFIVNNPHNPSGRIWKANDLEELKKLMADFPEVLLLSDEVYEYITFEQKHISINTIPELIDRSIIVSSFGKTLHITGWKIGYLVAPEHIMTEIKKVHQFNVFSVNSLSQDAIDSYLQELSLLSLGDFYAEKRDVFRTALQSSKFELLPCEGTYFQVVNYKNISNENDVDFCKRLTTEYGVAAIPISVFNGNRQDNKTIRFCFAKDNDTLLKAADILCKI